MPNFDFRGLEQQAARNRRSYIPNPTLSGTPYAGLEKYFFNQMQSGNMFQQQKTGQEWNDLSRFAAIFGNDPVNGFFDTSMRNINRAQGNAANNAQNQAAAYGASRGFANPGAFINSAGSQARAPYVQALGGLEGQRAGANQQFLQMLLQYLTQQQGIHTEQQRYDDARNDANSFDWGSLLPMFGTVAGAALGSPWLGAAFGLGGGAARGGSGVNMSGSYGGMTA